MSSKHFCFNIIQDCIIERELLNFKTLYPRHMCNLSLLF